MKSNTIIWIVAGFALLGLSGLLESLGDTGASASDRLTLYLPALAALGAANFCFYRGLRSALGSIWTGLWNSGSAGSKRAARPAYRMAEDEGDTASDFDADAAFARYMERRAAGLAAEPQPEPVTPSGPAPRPVARPAARPGFGRKTV